MLITKPKRKMTVCMQNHNKFQKVKLLDKENKMLPVVVFCSSVTF